MGQEIVYCNSCQTRLLGSDFDKGKAFRVEHQNLCLDCAQKLLGTLPPAERDAFAARMKGEAKKHSTVKIPVVRNASDSGGHSRLLRAAQPDHGTIPAPRPKRPAALVFGVVGGVLALLIAGIVVSTSSPARPQPPIVDGGAPPPPPPPGGNAPSEARRELDAARAWAKAHPDDFAGQIDRFQKVAWRPDAGPVAEEAKREMEASGARQAVRLTRDLSELDARVKAMTDRGEHGVALKTIEADRARHAAQDWTLALKRRSDAVVLDARARAAELRKQADQSRSDAAAMRSLRDRTASLGFPEFLSEFDAAAAAPTAPPTSTTPPAEGPPLVIFDERIGNDWMDFCWQSAKDFKGADSPAEGAVVAAWTPQMPWAGFYLGNPIRPPQAADFAAVEFSLRVPRSGGLVIVTLYGENGFKSKSLPLEHDRLPPPGQWRRYRFAISDFVFGAREIRGFVLQARDPETSPYHVDAVRFLRSVGPAAAPDASAPPVGEAATWRTAWLRAAALAAGRDYAAAEKELAIALPTLKDPQVKADAARDLADLKAAGAVLADAMQALAKWPRGMNLAGAVLEADGSRRAFDEPLRRADGSRLELRGGEVEVGDLLASSLAAIAKPKEPRAAALFCALEGDLDGARRLLGAEPPAAYRAHAATLSTEIDARRLWTEACAEWRDPAARVQAAGRYAALLRDHASSVVVRRNRATIAARSETPKEFYYATAELHASGAFAVARHPKGEIGWTMAEDSPKRGESWVEAAYSVPANAEVHAFVLAGACCLETWSSFVQASDLEGPDPEAPTSIVAADPGGPGMVPIPISLPFVKRTHALHGGGPKAPSRFEWLPLPVLKHAQGGPKRLRIVAEQQGFTVVAILVSNVRRAAPKEAEVQALEAGRPSAASLVDAGGGGGPRPGGILREVWEGLPGDRIGDLVDHPAFKSPPKTSEVRPSFEAPRSWQDSYGTRMRGWVVPPATGPYTFYLCSDDQGELWLGSDENASTKQKIAWQDYAVSYGDWTRVNIQTSREINLVRGRLYYIEALQKEGVGDDHLLVGWKLPDGTLERPIPGRRLVPWVAGAARGLAGAAPAVSVPPAHPAGTPVAITVDLGLGSAGRVDVYNGAQRLGEAKGSPPTFTWTAPPPGAHLIGARVTERGKTVNAVPAILPVGDVFLARLIDLNGPHGRERVATTGTGWERSDLELRPHADGERAELLRSTIASREGTKVSVDALPDGKAIVYLYATELEAAPQAWDLAVNGKNVLSGHRFAAAGDWARLGPFAVDVAGGRIELAASKGLAHFSGLELWTTGAPPRPQVRDKTASPGGPGGNPFEVVRGDDFLLVGFRYTIRQGILKSIRPIFGQGEKTFDGDQKGDPEGELISESAKPGYAVGGLQVRTGADRVRAVRVIYLRTWGGRLNPADRYEGPWWLGDEKDTQMLGGDGAPIVGIHGGAGGDVDRLGLIYLR